MSESPTPAFDRMVPITCPTLPKWEDIVSDFSQIVESGMITNSSHVRKFEERAAEVLQVRNAVAVSSCTSGLLLAFKAYGLTGEAILPSFTFMATGHPILWNGMTQQFAEVNPATFLMEPKHVEELITEKTSAILAVHLFGNPAYPTLFEELARKHHLKLIFDAAHGFGSSFNGKPIGGFGDAEVFSLSPTKLVVAGEGGLVTTNDDDLAKQIRIGRDYGNPGNYDCLFSGLNSRMAEMNGALALATLNQLPGNVERRNQLAEVYRVRLSKIPGIAFQTILPGAVSTYKDLSIVVDATLFGATRDELADALKRENIMTRKYFDPPLHLQTTYLPYRNLYAGRLSVTEELSQRCLSLPMFSHMETETVERICDTVERIRDESRR